MVDVLDQLRGLAIIVLLVEVRVHSSMQVFGFTYIDDDSLLVVVSVHSRLMGQGSQYEFDIIRNILRNG